MGSSSEPERNPTIGFPGSGGNQGVLVCLLFCLDANANRVDIVAYLANNAN